MPRVAAPVRTKYHRAGRDRASDVRCSLCLQGIRATLADAAPAAQAPTSPASHALQAPGRPAPAAAPRRPLQDSSGTLCPMRCLGDRGEVLRGQRKRLNIRVAEQVCLGKAMSAIQDQPAVASAHDVERVAQVGAGNPLGVLGVGRRAAPVPRAQRPETRHRRASTTEAPSASEAAQAESPGEVGRAPRAGRGPNRLAAARAAALPGPDRRSGAAASDPAPARGHRMALPQCFGPLGRPCAASPSMSERNSHWVLPAPKRCCHRLRPGP